MKTLIKDDELDIKFYIPEIVIDETLNNYNKRIHDLVNTIRNKQRELDKKLNEENPKIPYDFERKNKEYREFIQACFSSPNKIIVYPVNSHKDIAKRAMMRIRPFRQVNENVVGYRDTLIWLTILDIVKQEKNADIYYISNNSKDFCEKKGMDELHTHLKNEIDSVIDHTSNFYMFLNIDTFFEEVIKPDIKINKDLNEIYNKFALNQLRDLTFEDIIVRANERYEDSSVKIWLPDSNEGFATITYINEIKYDELGDIWHMQESEYAIECYLKMDAEFEYFVDKADYYMNEQPEYDVQDSDWNEHVVLVSINKVVDIIAFVTYKKDQNKCIDLSFEIND